MVPPPDFSCNDEGLLSGEALGHLRQKYDLGNLSSLGQEEN